MCSKCLNETCEINTGGSFTGIEAPRRGSSNLRPNNMQQCIVVNMKHRLNENHGNTSLHHMSETEPTGQLSESTQYHSAIKLLRLESCWERRPLQY